MIDEQIAGSAVESERSLDNVLAEAADSSRIFDSADEIFSSENLEHAAKAENFVERMTNLPDEIYECAITTVDNPFDPIDDFDQWFSFDEEKGYHTCSYLARIARVTDTMSDEEVSEEVERAIDEILDHDFLGIYKKVKRPLSDTETPESSSLKQSDLDENAEQLHETELDSDSRDGEISPLTPEGG